jgi:outer membrane protein
MNSKLIQKLLFLAVFLGFLGNTNGQNAMSLADCIAFATTNHPTLKTAQLQINDADWRVKESLAGGLPQVTAGLTYTGFIQRAGTPSSALSFGGGGGMPDAGAVQVLTDKIGNDGVGALGTFLGSLFASDPDSKLYFAPVHGISGNLSANQLIFSNSYLIAKKAARYYRDFVLDQQNVARVKLTNEVTDAYLPALILSENVNILGKNIENLEKLLKDTKEINKAGFAEQLDVDRLDLTINSLRNEIENLNRQKEIVTNVLKFTMSMPLTEQISLSDDMTKISALMGEADLVSELNPMKRAEYVNLLKGRELTALQLDLYKKPWMPTVAGFLQWQGGLQRGFGEKGGDAFKNWYFIPSTLGGLSVSTTLYDSGLNKAKKQRAMIAVQTIDEQKKTVENAFQLELATARKLYMNAQSRLANAQKNYDMAQKIYNTLQIKYKAGIGSSFEIISAERDLLTAQQAILTANFDILTSKVAIKKALGE